MSRRRKKNVGDKRLVFIESPIFGECVLPRRKGIGEDLVTKDIPTLDQALSHKKWIHPQFPDCCSDEGTRRGRNRKTKRTIPSCNTSKFPALRFGKSSTAVFNQSQQEDDDDDLVRSRNSPTLLDDNTIAVQHLRRHNTRAQKKLAYVLSTSKNDCAETASAHFLFEAQTVSDEPVILVTDTPDRDWGMTFRQRQLRSSPS